MTKDRPILFSASMVRAIIRECEKPGTGKTQTRRVMTPQPYVNGFGWLPGRYEIMCHNDWLPPSAMLWDVERFGRRLYTTSNVEGWKADLPWQVGDRLWVRETWADDEQLGGVLYRADHVGGDPIGNGWRPSIFMPRAKSRLTLAVTAVRVQKLQEISKEDAISEGIELDQSGRYNTIAWRDFLGGSPINDAINSFRSLWTSINGETGPKSWTANPYVVAVSFIPELRNIDAAPSYDLAPTDPHHGGKIWP